ncbi:hypothetical protein ES705_38488 [subsurface metagenome]
MGGGGDRKSEDYKSGSQNSVNPVELDFDIKRLWDPMIPE